MPWLLSLMAHIPEDMRGLEELGNVLEILAPEKSPHVTGISRNIASLT